MRGALGGPRVLLRRLREVMAEPVSAQERLDKIVVLIAANMVAEVCSVYVLRVDGTLELYATEGLNRQAVHMTVLRADEGLVGLVAREAKSISLSDAQKHPAFSYRPETGEEIYHSFLGVPILRAGNTLGVLVVQNRAHRTYSEDEEEALHTMAMVLAEMIASGELSVPARPGAVPVARRALHLSGMPLADGIGIGYVVLHEPRVVITNFIADDVQKEVKRLEAAVDALRADLDEMLERADVADAGEHRDVLEAYRMFAYDRGWMHKLREAVMTGLTAEAAVERVQSDVRARILRQSTSFLRDRLHDLDDLANRLMRQLTGQGHVAESQQLPEDAIIVARSMSSAELLDYDRSRLRGLVLEEGSATSHVSIVARALGIAAIGGIDNATGMVDPGDAIIVDGSSGELHVRPPPDIQSAYGKVATTPGSQRPEEPSPPIPPEIPTQGPGPHFVLRNDCVVDFAPPASIDSQGNNVPHLRALHPIIRTLAGDATRALGRGNMPHSVLHDRAQSYCSLIDRELDELSFALLYIEGVRLQNAFNEAIEKIVDRELPPLELTLGETLKSLLRLHGAFMLSTADGLALVAVEERYQRRPHEEEELRRALLAHAQELNRHPEIMSPEAATFVLKAAEEFAKGTHPERSSIVAVSTARNAAIVVISGATLGALPLIGSLVGPAGLIGGGLAALIGVESLKKAKSFLAITGLVTRGLDQFSEADVQKTVAEKARKLAAYVHFVHTIEPVLRRLVEKRDQFSWLAASLDWLSERAKRRRDP